MPRGTHHVEIGQLDHDGQSYGLLREAGGRWQLNVPRRARRLVGQRVRIEGIRVGFSELSVSSIEALVPADRSATTSKRLRAAIVPAVIVFLAILAWYLLA
ncbi:MAG TPA: DUF5818 domain-containing protein [Sphingomonas sp.]|jgi:fatty acid desaturase|uniref:DUF5818 domain-containing protein n=1 Tax=Sphingomonas sp. TaxID=28214 RepID=UPI002ED89364